MIRIIVDGIELDVSQTALRWENVNGLFSDELQADYSFPFTLAYSAVNMKALRFAQLADVPTKSVRFPCIVILDNMSINSTLIINGTTRNGFNVNIAGGVNGLVNSSKKLSELPYYIESTGEGRIDLGPGFGNMALFQYARWQNAIAFPPHYNPNFYGSTNTDFQGIVNKMDATVGSFLANDLVSGNKYCFVPFVYMRYILQTIADENGLELSGTFIEDIELSNTLHYNNYALDKELDIGCTVKLPANYHFGPAAVVYSTLVNLLNNVNNAIDPSNGWNNTGHYFVISVAGDWALKFQMKVKIPGPYGAFVFMQIYQGGTNVANNGPFGELITPGVWHTITCSVPLVGVTVGTQFSTKWGWDAGSQPITILVDDDDSFFKIYRYDGGIVNEMDKNVLIKNHVPDVTVAEYFRLIKNWAQVEITPDWNDRKLIMNLAEKSISASAEVDLTDLADPNYEQVFDEKSLGFTLSYDFGSQDGLITGNFKTYDESKLIGEFLTPVHLPPPGFLEDLAIVKNKNKIVRCELVSGVMTWVEYCDNYYQITEGNGKVERKIELAPMMMTDQQENDSVTGNANHRKCLMPQISETGSSPLFGLGINTASLRVVFMRGKNLTTAVGGNYIYASSTNVDLNGNSIWNYTLKLQGLDGWYIRWLQKILLAIDNSAVFEFMIMLPALYLRYRGKVQINYVNFMIKNISMPIGTFIGQSLVKVLKLF